MRKAEKEAKVAELGEEVRGASGLLLTEYRGLTVRQMAGLRQALRPRGASFRVVKNSLFRRALEACEQQELAARLEGPIAVAFISGEAAPVVKEILDYSKGAQDLPVLRAGLVEGRLLSQGELLVLASLPSREHLLASLAGLLQAPLANLVATLQAGPARLVCLLEALAERKAAESAPA
jgi:large subunit ribosomal protein L10